MQYLPAVINKPISPFHSVEFVDYKKAKDTSGDVIIHIHLYVGFNLLFTLNITQGRSSTVNNIAWVDLRPVVLLNILL